jgi:hypothetical protein
MRVSYFLTLEKAESTALEYVDTAELPSSERRVLWCDAPMAGACTAMGAAA